MISFVINSVTPSKFATASTSIARAMGGEPHEVVGIHDAKSMCDGYRRGLARSRGDPVVFCHDDMELLMTDLPARLGRHFERFDLIAPVGTRKLVGMNWARAGADNLFGMMAGAPVGGKLGLGYFGGAERQVGGIVAFEGVFIAARRAVAEAIGWDAETFDDWHGYDTDFSFRAHLAGYRLGVVLDLAIIHRSTGTFGPGYAIAEQRFARKHAGRLASGHGYFLCMNVPVADHAAVTDFCDHGDIAELHRESRVRIHRAVRGAGHRAPAALMASAWDPVKAERGAGIFAADPPTRNGPCTCGNGLRFKDCHGRVKAATG